MPSIHHVASFQHLLGTLSRGANRAVHNLITHTNSADIPDAYPALITPYIAAAAQVSAHWYHSLAPARAFAAQAGPLPPVDQLQANARYALSTDNPFSALSMTTQRHVFQTSAATIITNADKEHVRYARYASSTACAFCRLLATKTKGLVTDPAGVKEDPITHQLKFVVSGRAGRQRGTRPIGELYHDDCKCVAVPIRPGDSYTPPDYVKQWEDDYKAATDDPDVHSFDQIVNHMRRTEYARAHERAAAPQPEAAESPFSGLSVEPAASPFSELSQATP